MAITSTGTQLTFNDATVQSTAFTGAVTSVATGNGLQGGTITSTGTLSVACPTFNTVGSYCFAMYYRNNSTNISSGDNRSAGGGTAQIQTALFREDESAWNYQNNLSGTWKWMAASSSNGVYNIGVACRVS